MAAGSDSMPPARLQELFGSELGSRLSQLVNLGDGPALIAPSHAQSSAEPAAHLAGDQPSPRGPEPRPGPQAGASRAAPEPRAERAKGDNMETFTSGSRSARAAALERAGSGSLSTDKDGPATGSGGLFSRIKGGAPWPSPRTSIVSDANVPGHSGRKTQPKGDTARDRPHSVSGQGCQPGADRGQAEGLTHTAAEKRRQEMTARAQAALRRKHRREQETGTSMDRDDTPSSSERELYTLLIDCRANRRQTLSIVLTKAEFTTFAFKDLQQRLSQERHWGPELPVAFAVKDSMGRARVVGEHEVLSSNVGHNGTVIVEFSATSAASAPPGRASAGERCPPAHPSQRPWSAASRGQPSPSHPSSASDCRLPRTRSAATRPGYASRAAAGSGGGAQSQARPRSQDFLQGALWSSDLTTVPQSSMANLSDRQLQVFLAQAGMPSSTIRTMPRSQLVPNAETHVPAWEVARVLACSSPWQVLRIPAEANAGAAKAAYRKLSMKIHPDKNPSSEAARAMSVATEALKSVSKS